MGTSGLDFKAGGGASTCPTATLTAAGQQCTESVTFTPAAPGVRMGAVVLLDGNKNVLGTAYLSGTGLGGLGVLTPGNVLTMAGVYKTEVSTKDGILATQANLNEPASVTLDGAGNMYIADSLHNKVRIVAAPIPPATVGIISTFAGTGAADYSGDNGKAVKATLDSPAGVAPDGAGNLYIADTNNNVIRKVTAANGVITTVAGNGTGGYTADNIAATSASQPAQGHHRRQRRKPLHRRHVQSAHSQGGRGDWHHHHGGRRRRPERKSGRQGNVHGRRWAGYQRRSQPPLCGCL